MSELAEFTCRTCGESFEAPIMPWDDDETVDEDKLRANCPECGTFRDCEVAR
jgi:DNA-directed RNA polymerase subunit RPC12/RpoP